MGACILLLVFLSLGAGLQSVLRLYRSSKTAGRPVAATTPARVEPQPASRVGTAAGATPTLAAAVPAPKPTPAVQPTVPAPQSALSAVATLSGVRHVSNTNSTAVELVLDRPVKYTTNTLHDPERVFLDLEDTRVASALGATPDEVGDGRILRVRVGRHEAKTRVVLDLNCPCEYSSKMLQRPPYGLVVAVRSK